MVLPPEIREVPTVRFKSLPNDCFDPIPVVLVERGDDNETVARAYRENVSTVVSTNTRLAGCQKLNGADASPSESGEP